MPAHHFRPTRLIIRLLILLAIASAGLGLTTSHIDPSAVESLSARIDESAGYSLLLFFSIAAATLVSEDLTCIAAGMLAGAGRLDFWFATAACMAGIFIGDLLLFLAGRVLGRRALRFPVLRSMVTEETFRDASEWLGERGFKVILISRFMPGTRLPVYFAAGALETKLVDFSRWFLVAVAIWTPILVALAARWNDFASAIDFGLAALVAAGLALALHLLTLDWRSRRLLLAKWRRLTRWEFWPTWFFYLPVYVWMVLLAVRHRSMLVFTAVNPAIPAGGLIGESKSRILEGFSDDDRHRLKAQGIAPGPDCDDRMRQFEEFLNRERLSYPVVVKPDAGQRGSGVVITQSRDEVVEYLKDFRGPVLAQEYIGGPELGVFYVRHPDSETGEIFSITGKTLIEVTGDGKRTLEQLILGDDRAICQAEQHLSRHKNQLTRVPTDGDAVPLVDLGTHCRGALFTDGSAFETPALANAIDELSRSFDGFFFGRYDIRGESIEAIQRGEFKVIELNGVTSEATAIYDPANSLISAWGTLFRQWSLAFEIGAANVRRGHKASTIREILQSLREYRSHSSTHPEPTSLPR